jgi:Ala-tRNA(Pro) deacylase
VSATIAPTAPTVPSPTSRTNADAPHAGLIDWLSSHGVGYELRAHPPTFTALQTADREGIDPVRFAKALVVEAADGNRAIVVVDALDRINLNKVARALHTDEARLLEERELAGFAPGVALGAIPAVGDLFGVRVYADYAIYEAPEITFPAGSHAYTVTVDRPAWGRAARVVFVDLMDDEDRPVWQPYPSR